MKISIEKTATGLDVRIEVLAGREQLVLDRIRACRATAWACPSGECTKIGTMEEQPAAGSVRLRLAPLPGEALSASGIEECLRYMLR